MRNVRCTVVDFRWRHDEYERRCRECRKRKRRDGASHEDLRRDRTPGVFLMIDDGAVMRRCRRMSRQMRVECLTVVMRRVVRVQMNVRQRRGKRPELHEHDKRRRRELPHHGRIVANDALQRHLTNS